MVVVVAVVARVLLVEVVVGAVVVVVLMRLVVLMAVVAFFIPLGVLLAIRSTEQVGRGRGERDVEKEKDGALGEKSWGEVERKRGVCRARMRSRC